jgi:hypothetical protein
MNRMNEIASIFISVFSDESVAYWCFSNYMLLDTVSSSDISLFNTNIISETHILKTNVAYYFSDTGMWTKLNHLQKLVEATDPHLYKILKDYNVENLVFCHEWVLLGFLRSFHRMEDYIGFFEILSSHFLELHTSSLNNISLEQIFSFDMFICLALLEEMKPRFVNECKNGDDFFEIIANNKYLLGDNCLNICRSAQNLFEKYCIKSLPFYENHFLDKNNNNNNKKSKKQK